MTSTAAPRRAAPGVDAGNNREAGRGFLVAGACIAPLYISKRAQHVARLFIAGDRPSKSSDSVGGRSGYTNRVPALALGLLAITTGCCS